MASQIRLVQHRCNKSVGRERARPDGKIGSCSESTTTMLDLWFGPGRDQSKKCPAVACVCLWRSQGGDAFVRSGRVRRRMQRTTPSFDPGGAGPDRTKTVGAKSCFRDECNGAGLGDPNFKFLQVVGG